MGELLHAIRDKYADPAEDEEFIVGGRRVEMVGMEKMQRKFSALANTRTLSLRGALPKLDISSTDASQVGSECPRVEEVDFSQIAMTWDTVQHLGVAFPNLRVLNISENVAILPSEPLRPPAVFRKLKEIVLNFTGVQFQTIVRMGADVFPSLQQLHLESCDIGSLDVVDCDVVQQLPELELLNLTNNVVTSWKDLSPIQHLRKLKSLILTNNRITELYADRMVTDGDTRVPFSTLTSLSIADNPIVDGASHIVHLLALPALTALRVGMLDTNWTVAQARAFIIPRLPKLEVLNGSKISPKERNDLERLYQKQQQQQQQGTADDGGCKTASSAITLTLKSCCTFDSKHRDKCVSLPQSCTVQNLKNMFHAQFGVRQEEQRLVAKDPAAPLEVILLKDELYDLHRYCLMDGMVIEMHKRDAALDRIEEERAKQELERKMLEQQKQTETQLHMQRMRHGCTVTGA